MNRNMYDEDNKFHAIEKWEINSKTEAPEEVWEYERTRIDKPKKWVKLDLNGKFYVWKK